MKQFTVQITNVQQLQVHAEDARDAVRVVQSTDLLKGRVDFVEDVTENGKRFDYIGTCEDCGKIILDEEGYREDIEGGLFFCEECAKKSSLAEEAK